MKRRALVRNKREILKNKRAVLGIKGHFWKVKSNFDLKTKALSNSPPCPAEVVISGCFKLPNEIWRIFLGALPLSNGICIMSLVWKTCCNSLAHLRNEARLKRIKKSSLNVDIYADGAACIHLAYVEKHIKGEGLLD